MSRAQQPPDVVVLLEQGYSLPSEWYVSAAHHALEQEHIFRRSWQYVGLAEQVTQPGDYFTITIGGVPLIITRDRAKELHALVNVCRHRGSIIVTDECGHRSSLQCPYHAWTYDLNGTLRQAPGAADEPDFDRQAFALPQAKLATWGPFIFVNLDPDAAPLSSVLALELFSGPGRARLWHWVPH
jgi:choline monooxygenase